MRCHPALLRPARYLRLSVTDRCNLRCLYCMPAEGVAPSPRQDLLSIEELARVVRICAGFLGARTVRLTGGEPLVRRGITDLVRKIRDIGIDDVALTTNGVALGHLARDLVSAGVTRANISLDSLRPDRFTALTRGGELARTLYGIDAALDAGFGTLKTNTVVIRDENDDELPAIVDWAWERGLVPRFIELIPIGAGAQLGARPVVSVAEMRARLADRIHAAGAPSSVTGRGPATYYLARGARDRAVGFIGAVTESFCSRCDRIRVSAQGELRTCLASPRVLDLRALLRSGACDSEIAAQLAEELSRKGRGHDFACGEHDGAGDLVMMSRVGG